MFLANETLRAFHRWIYVYLIHIDMRVVPLEETLTVMRAEGFLDAKVLSFGVFTTESIALVICEKRSPSFRRILKVRLANDFSDSNQRLERSLLHNLLRLIDQLPLPDDFPVSAASRNLLEAGRFNANGVAKK